VGRSPLHLDELVENWTELEDERTLVAGKRGTTRLGLGKGTSGRAPQERHLRKDTSGKTPQERHLRKDTSGKS